MATMIKEKRRDKKKTKSKHSSKNEDEPEQLFEDKQNISPTVSVTCNPETCSFDEGNVTSDVTIETNDTDEKTALEVEAYVEEENLEVKEDIDEKVEASAPVFEEHEVVSYPVLVEVSEQQITELITHMPLEEAIRLFGGKEIADVKAISELEEVYVQGGPQCRPDHPLIDYLSTFRSSLKAVERERNRIANGYDEEEKSRETLWKVTKRTVNISEKCPCGAPITFKATFDVANLEKERLPAARMRLESLLREVEESYCHHQHITLQTHYDIDELISEILQSHKDNVKEALFLVFDAMRLSDDAPEAYAQALQRWACILSSSLLDQECDEALSYLMFFLHSIFRQTRSVQWAGSVFSLQVTDMSSAATLIGILEVILTRPVLEAAQECSEEAWEEVDDRGEGCAVGEGRLRERDLLALLQAMPLRDMLARMLLFTGEDISQESDVYWGDRSGGHGVLKCCCGVRALLHVARRGHDAHAGYARLRRRLRRLAVAALNALAALHARSRLSYTAELEGRVSAELEACFAAGFSLLQEEAYKIDASLLRARTAAAYVRDLARELHTSSPAEVSALRARLRAPCDARVRLAAAPALQRADDGLAREVMDFLFYTGVRQQQPACPHGCGAAARAQLAPLLAAQPRLHTVAFHLLAEYTLSENMEPSVLEHLACEAWRPAAAEARALLADWAARCPALLQQLLLRLDYTPHTGVSLDTQLMIGAWVCEWAVPRAPAPEWAWGVLRRLRVHRAHWRLPLDAPPPAPPAPPRSLLHTAFALLASDWGHSLPLICGPGVEALHQVAQARPADAAHCAALLMQVMAQSPESVSLTPKFTEVFSVILGSGPSLVQRALGHRVPTGQETLQNLLVMQMMDTNMEASHRSALVAAWLHALWRPALPAAARAALDAALRAARDWRTLDAHAHALLQGEQASEFLWDAVRHAAAAPLLAEAALRAAHAAEARSRSYARLLAELRRQRLARQRIHVDNALKIQDDTADLHGISQPVVSKICKKVAGALARISHRFIKMPTTLYEQEEKMRKFRTIANFPTVIGVIDCTHIRVKKISADGGQLYINRKGFPSINVQQVGWSVREDELAVHRCGAAALAASAQHPAHALLWRLLLHVYLQRAPADRADLEPPVGPLFFSGIIKSRTLYQLKKRLQETALFHHTQIEVYKSTESSVVSTPTSSVVKDNTSIDNEMFPTLTMIDLTGVSSSQSDCTLSESDVSSAKETSTDRDIHNLLNYHIGAEKLIREYLMWLEEGEDVRAQPHHADISRFLTEQALDAAWRASLGMISCTSRSPSPPLGATPPATPPTPATPPMSPAPGATHAQRAAAAILAVTEGAIQRYKIPPLPQPLDHVYFTDSYLLYQMVDKYLSELKQISEQWAAEVRRAAQLDAALWALVRARRVGRALPPARRACAQACAPRLVRIPEIEWCISSAAEQGIQDNRRSARSAVRQLTRPRPDVARLASIVSSIGRRIAHASCALEVAERAARVAAATARCAPAHAAVVALVSNVAQRFICTDGKLASECLARWMRGGRAQQQLCGELVAPPRLPPPAWPRLYNTVLTLNIEPHVAFSFLSKFDMWSWAERAESSQRGEVLEALVKAALRLGPAPPDAHLVLLEILDRHSGAVVRTKEVCAHTLRVAHASLARRLPARYCAHLPAAASALAHALPFDQLGHLLRELGVIFWEARSGAEAPAPYAQYAPHLTGALHGLLQGFVAAAVARDYSPERVAYYATSALHESWAAWVAPGGDAPLAPGAEDDVAARFCDAVRMLMQAVPGCSGHVLRYVWQWAAATCAGGAGGVGGAAALLAQLARLPWDQRWFHVDCLLLMPQIISSSNQSLQSWCAGVMRHVAAGDWLAGCADDQLVPNLLAVLNLLTSKEIVLPDEALEEACNLPWHRLPTIAVEEAFEKYFVDHYSTAVPYHEQPHFKVMLAACALRAGARGTHAAERRARGVALWLRAAAAPALLAHVPGYSRCLLQLMDELAPHLEQSPGELEGLLGRALAIMCIEPAAASALPVWEQWVARSPAGARRACAAAVAGLTAPDYFAALADAVAKAIMNETEGSWSEVSSRWARCAWAEGGALVGRRRAHAAYALLLARPHSHAHLRQMFRSLANTEIDFSENEIIISVWICAACRVAVGAGGEGGVEAGAEARECAEAARALLLRWAEQRRSLLHLVALSTASCPTQQHRLLCRLALCIISPSESATRSYEAACAAVGVAPAGPAPGAAPGPAPGPAPRALPRLAARLHPAHARYFHQELQLMPETM